MTIAVNSMRRNVAENKMEPVATFYRLKVWGKEGENCAKYLSKGRRIGCHGELSVSLAKDDKGNLMKNKNDEPIINLEVNVEGHVEFLSNAAAPQESGEAPQRREETTQPANENKQDNGSGQQDGFTQVEMDDELPF